MLVDNQEYYFFMDMYSDFEASTVYAHLSTYQEGNIVDFRGITDERKRKSFIGDNTARVVSTA